jgi:hypothetical protein
MKRLHADPGFAARHAAASRNRMRRLNADPNFVAARAAALLKKRLSQKPGGRRTSWRRRRRGAPGPRRASEGGRPKTRRGWGKWPAPGNGRPGSLTRPRSGLGIMKLPSRGSPGHSIGVHGLACGAAAKPSTKS